MAGLQNPDQVLHPREEVHFALRRRVWRIEARHDFSAQYALRSHEP